MQEVISTDAEHFDARSGSTDFKELEGDVYSKLRVYVYDRASRQYVLVGPGCIASSARTPLDDQIDGYFASKGASIRTKRARLVEAINGVPNSNLASDLVQKVLHQVGQRRSQESLSAAIDLLARFPDLVRNLAAQITFSVNADQTANTYTSDALFVMGMAAGKAYPSFVRSGLLDSEITEFREAGIELTSEMPSVDRVDVLTAFLIKETDPCLRKLAEEAIQDLD